MFPAWLVELAVSPGQPETAGESGTRRRPGNSATLTKLRGRPKADATNRPGPTEGGKRVGNTPVKAHSDAPMGNPQPRP